MKTNKLWYFLFVLILATSCKSSEDEVLVGNWTKMGSFEGPSRDGASYFVINDSVYVGLGAGSNVTSGVRRLKDLWVYDVTKNTWHARASLPAEAMPRADASSFATDTKGYICAGLAEGDGDVIYMRDLWEYTPGTNAWVKKADLPASAEARSEAVGIGFKNKGYVGAGKGENYDQLKDFYEYNPATNQWSVKASIGGDKRRGAISFVVNNMIYVCTGIGNGLYLTDLWAYNVTTDEWIKKADMRNATDESFDDKYGNMARAFGVSFVIDNKAYITLGTSGSLRPETWEYDPITDRWNQKTSFEGSGRIKAVGFSVFDKKTNKQRVFVTTGSSGNNRFDDIWEFKPNDEKNDNDNQ